MQLHHAPFSPFSTFLAHRLVEGILKGIIRVSLAMNALRDCWKQFWLYYEKEKGGGKKEFQGDRFSWENCTFWGLNLVRKFTGPQYGAQGALWTRIINKCKGSRMLSGLQGKRVWVFIQLLWVGNFGGERRRNLGCFLSGILCKSLCQKIYDHHLHRFSWLQDISLKETPCTDWPRMEPVIIRLQPKPERTHWLSLNWVRLSVKFNLNDPMLIIVIHALCFPLAKLKDHKALKSI